MLLESLMQMAPPEASETPAEEVDYPLLEPSATVISKQDLLAHKDAKRREKERLARLQVQMGLPKGAFDPRRAVERLKTEQATAFEKAYSESYELPLDQTAYQRILRNVMLTTALNSSAKFSERLKAVELLGKTQQVGMFNEDKTITIVNKTASELKDELRDKLRQIIDTTAE